MEMQCDEISEMRWDYIELRNGIFSSEIIIMQLCC